MLVLVLDIETTGLSKTNDSITVIGTIVYDSETDCTLSKKCFNVAVAHDSKLPSDLVEMKHEVTKLLDDAGCVVAFNGINFDMPFILKWLLSPPACLPTASSVLLAQRESTANGSTAKKRRRSADAADPACNLMSAILGDVTRAAVAAAAAGVTVAVDIDRWKHKYLDFCHLSKVYTGSYISLHNACLHNKIEVAKSGSGLQAIEWAHRKQWALLESYCMQDVVVLLALTKHAIRRGLRLPLVVYGKQGKNKEGIVLRFDGSMQPFVRSAEKHPNAPCPDIFDTSSPKALVFGGHNGDGDGDDNHGGPAAGSGRGCPPGIA